VTCANCGETNPARARFCLTCGSPLAAGGRRRGVQANALLDHAGVLRLGGRADQAAPLLREALALGERQGDLVTGDRARELLAGRADA
jgi:Double zinc ribbon